jgi:ferredoxin
MPDSCIIFPTVDAVKRKMLANHDAVVARIKDAVNERREFKIKPKKPFTAKTRFMWRFFKKGLKTDRKHADGNCTRCGKCVKTCPTGNISINERVEFGDNCDTCFGCVQICPSRAVHFGKLTVDDRTSYHHTVLDD